MNALPNPNTFEGKRLIVPVAIERDWSAVVRLKLGEINFEESDPYESYIEVTFEVCGPRGKRHWIVIQSHPMCPWRAP